MASVLFTLPSYFSNRPHVFGPPSSLASGVQCAHCVLRPVLATSSVKPSEAQTKLNELWAYLVDKEIVPKSGSIVKPEMGKLGACLVAQRPIGQWAEVVSVPQEVWINVATVKTSEIGKYCEGLRPWVTIAVFLLFEKAKANSRWRWYIDTLPENLESPLFWSEEELAELQGTQLLGSVQSYREYLESEYNMLLSEVILPNPQIFDRSVFTPEAFLWAFGILRSRTFPPLTGDDLALVPLADLMNHGMALNTDGPTWEKRSSGLFNKQEVITVRTSIAVKLGNQVLMQYGKKKNNAQLALDYGFVERSPMITAIRDGYTLTLSISESDRFFDDKVDIAEQNGLNATAYFDLITGKGPPENMLAFLRLTALSGSDAFLLEALFRNTVWEHLKSPVSRENEAAVCKAFLDGCRSAQAGYPVSIAEDKKTLRADNPVKLSRRLEMAVVVRQGEKLVLEEMRVWFEKQMASLDQLEYYAERRLRNLGLLDEKGNRTPWANEN